MDYIYMERELDMKNIISIDKKDPKRVLVSIRNDKMTVDFTLSGEHEYTIDDFANAIGEPIDSKLVRYLNALQIVWKFVAYDPDKVNKNSFSSLARELPGFRQKEIHPIHKFEEELGEIIINLNDYHNWSFDQIADWIESLDNIPTFDIPAEPEEEEVKNEAPPITVLASTKKILP